MKNNFRALILHLIIVILSFLFLIIFVAMGPKIGKYATNIISRIFIGIIFPLAYIFAGTLLDVNVSKKYDFFTGSFIAILGVLIWYYTFSLTNKSLFEIQKELIEYWILINIYHTPFIFMNLLFELSNNPLISLIMNLYPSILMGIGLKFKRLRNRYYN